MITKLRQLITIENYIKNKKIDNHEYNSVKQLKKASPLRFGIDYTIPFRKYFISNCNLKKYIKNKNKKLLLTLALSRLKLIKINNKEINIAHTKYDIFEDFFDYNIKINLDDFVDCLILLCIIIFNVLKIDDKNM